MGCSLRRYAHVICLAQVGGHAGRNGRRARTCLEWEEWGIWERHEREEWGIIIIIYGDEMGERNGLRARTWLALNSSSVILLSFVLRSSSSSSSSSSPPRPHGPEP